MFTIMRVVRAFIILVTVSGALCAQNAVFTLLHVNDSHSTLGTIGPRTADLHGSLGGIARVATLVARVRAEDDHVLALHAGDLFIGDMFFNSYFGVPELQVLQSLGFDAMAVGNHEFDLTPAVLLQALQSAFPEGGFPLLSANLGLDAPEVASLKGYIRPYTIRTFGDVKVGIFGLTTPATSLLSQPAPVTVSEDFLGAAAHMVEELRGQGCQVVICLSHLGMTYDTILAQYVPGIDIIVGGHDHVKTVQPVEITNPSGSKTSIVQANAFYLHVGRMKVQVHKGNVRILNYRLIDVTDSIPEEPLTAALVGQLEQGIEATYGPVFSQAVAQAGSYFEEVSDDPQSAGPKDTPIGNLVADAFRARTGTEVAFEVGGSTAQPLYAGPLVAADLFRTVGYGFNTDNGLGYRLATFTLTGVGLYSGLEFGVSDLQNDEYLAQVSGLQYQYDPSAPPFSRITGVLVNGEPLDPERTYTVTANEFVPMFLGYLGIECGNVQVVTALSEFQVLTEYVAGRTLTPTQEGRIVCTPAPATRLALQQAAPTKAVKETPAEFGLGQNYPNPFNPSTTITYSLPDAGTVSLKVYNLLGQEVATLFAGTENAGHHRVVWNAGSCASGVYLVRLEANGRSAVQKVHLLK